jgi:hypothetical protein
MANIVTFDPEYFQELAKDLAAVSRSLEDAKASMQKASVGLDSGLVAFAMCYKLNEDINSIKKNTNDFLDKASGFSKVLMEGVARVNGWEEIVKKVESALALLLKKIWGFENSNWSTDGNDPSRAPAGTAPGGKPDLNDWYYAQETIGGAGMRVGDGINPIDGKLHLNCVYYARARAMQVNWMTEWKDGSPGENIETIRPNSIAKFDGPNGHHEVFIESVEYDSNNQPVNVTFSEGNWGNGHPDPHIDTISWKEFKHRDGKAFTSYTYF